MVEAEFVHIASDGHPVFVRKWSPAGTPKAALIVIHGMAEHSARYRGLAEAMTQAGWAVYVPDLRGHGKTAVEGRLGWIAERDGFGRIRADLKELAASASAQEGGAPLFLFGHSMGSLIAETLLAEGASSFAGCALSGVIAPPPPALLAVGRLLAAIGALIKGGTTRSPLLHAMSFGANNKYFEPSRTACDWLTRDAAAVDAYIGDGQCGFACSFDLYRDLFSGLSMYLSASPFARLGKDLPVYVFAGAEDPIGGAKGFVAELAGMLRKAGLRDIETRLYPGARHETLNETNRDEVARDLRDWLEARLSALLARPSSP